ncbi:MAG: histidine kinase, partial [Nitrospira sp.]|nr:histidine kinase [Nitrospira sp.]
MRKDTKKFQILDGLRSASLYTPRAKPADHPQPRRGRGSSSTHCIEPRRQDLPTALTAMEQRLSSLLEDRSRIGQDLHDCILQSLYAIESTVKTKRLAIPDCPSNTMQTPQDITGQINRLIGDIRQMIQGLNGEVVNDSRLTDDLYALKSLYDEIGHVRITLNLHPAAVEVLTRDEEREILTIVREA